MRIEHGPFADVVPEPGVPKPDPILEIGGLRRAFGGLQAVDVEHLEVQRGTITSLIGPNGAGKTTLFNLVTGFDRSDQGTWHLNGGPIVGIPSFRVARKGMVRTFQLTRSLARLTVLENMLVAAKDQPGENLRSALFGRWRHIDESNEVKARDLLDSFGMAHMASDYAGALSGGQRKLLEMARALMVGPELVMLDEPVAGVNPALTQSIIEHIQRLRDEGLTVVFIEHDMDVVQEISDWVVCLSEGAVIAEGPSDVVAADRHVIEAYLGAHYVPVDE
jgi:branched-chain amino acid transport system ATP-binding protein